MFVRRRKNKSGTTSIHIIDKSSGKYRVVKSMGASNDLNEIERLAKKAEDELLPSHENQPPLFHLILPGMSPWKTFSKV